MYTELRKLVKCQIMAGHNLLAIVHPRTQVANPTRVPNVLIARQIESGIYSELVNDLDSINTKVAQDLIYSQRVFRAFSIPYGDFTSLQEAINNYSLLPNNRDLTALKTDQICNTIEIINVNNFNSADLVANFMRTSTMLGVVTLEDIALYLTIHPIDSLTDIELAQSILEGI